MTIEHKDERELTITLTGFEFGALAGAVSTEAARLTEAKGKAAADYLLDVLSGAWLKMLTAWHPNLEVGMIKYTDEVTLFGDHPFDPETGWSNKSNDPVDSDGDGTVDIAPVIDLFKKSG